MKKVTLLFCLFSAAALAAVHSAPALTGTADPLPALTEPPALTVRYGEQEIQAWRGSSDWQDGNTGWIACGPAPNDPTVRDDLPLVSARPGETLRLSFPVRPDSCGVTLWPDVPGADGGAVPLSPDSDGRLPLPDSFRGVYEIWAEWDPVQNCGGKACYAFLIGE